MFEYSLEQIKVLNSSLKKFPYISLIDPKDNKSFEGESRFYFLNFYTKKDTDLISLTPGDLLLVSLSKHGQESIKVIGNLLQILPNDELEIQVESNELHKLPSDLKHLKIITCLKKDVEKPLELYFEQVARRVAKTIAKFEKKRKRRMEMEQKFATEIATLNFLPAPTVLNRSQSDQKQSYFDAYTLANLPDSRIGLAQFRQEIIEILSHHGCVGVNGATLRPKGSLISSINVESPGAVTWVNDLSKTTEFIIQKGNTKGKQLTSLADWHPDVVEFIVSKINDPRIFRWILDNIKDPLIIKEVKQKFKFFPLTEVEKKYHENILSTSSDEDAKNASKTILEEAGSWKIINQDFLAGTDIAIAISDQFMNAVKINAKWTLKYPDLINLSRKQKNFYDANWSKINNVFHWEELNYPVKNYYEINAKNLWDLIIYCSLHLNQPLIYFVDTINQASVVGDKSKNLIVIDPLNHLPLHQHSVCNLGWINLANFIDKSSGNIKQTELEETVRIAVRFLDNVIDANEYFSLQARKHALGMRPIGLGIIGLHDFFIWSSERYGSKKSRATIDLVASTIAKTAYRASVDLAVEKKPYKFLKRKNFKLLSESNYVKSLLSEIVEKITKKGLRNSCVLASANAFELSKIVGVANGVDAYHSFYLDENQTSKIPLVNEWLQYNETVNPQGEYESLVSNLPPYFASATDIPTEEHVKVQNSLEKFYDSAVIKTVYISENASLEQVEKTVESLYDGQVKVVNLMIFQGDAKNYQSVSNYKTTEQWTNNLKATNETKTTGSLSSVQFLNSKQVTVNPSGNDVIVEKPKINEPQKATSPVYTQQNPTVIHSNNLNENTMDDATSPETNHEISANNWSIQSQSSQDEARNKSEPLVNPNQNVFTEK